MMDHMFIWTRILFLYCCVLTVHGVQPNCTSVTDFDNCPGNTTGFCPNNIVCACKDGKPFCKCPNFRGQWGNYWYMGAKCDQLWSTLDLVLVAVLPGIGLALIVGVTIQTAHYCQKKSEKNTNDQRQQRSLSGLQPQQNPAYTFDTALRFSQSGQDQLSHLPSSGPLGWGPGVGPGLLAPEISPPNFHPPLIEDYEKKAEKETPKKEEILLNNTGVKMGAQSLSFPNSLLRSPVSPPQFSERNHNLMPHEPKGGSPYIWPSYNSNSSSVTTPAIHYGNKYSSAMNTQPLFNFSTPGAPKSNYIPREKQQIGYPNSVEHENPYRMGRVQIKPNY